MQQTKLLVALSLVLPVSAAADDKHKQPSGRFGKARPFVARAYSSGRLTSLGEIPVAGVTIAADPKVIPMGSRVRISGAGAYSGVYRVGDVGSAIKGNKIDVYVRSREEAIQFGRKNVAITLLSTPRKPGRAFARRTEKQMPHFARKTRCEGCGNLQAKAIMNVDEARGSSSSLARRSVPSGGSRSRTGESDPRQSGGSAAFARLSAF